MGRVIVGLGFVVLGLAGGELDAQVEVFAPGSLSSEGGESWVSFDPSGEIAIFGRHGDGWSEHTFYLARRTAGGWSDPVVAPFSGGFGDRGARFTPDGTAVVFSSNRPLPGQDGASRRVYGLWTVPYEGSSGDWGEPRPVPGVGSVAHEIHPSVAGDGTIYFASSREGGLGRSDLYRARPDGDTYLVESLGPTINTEFSEPDVFVDPAGRFIVFSRTDGPGGFGGDDLYVSFREGDGWSEPRNLGPEINSAEYEYGPLVSPDGGTLFFTSHRNGPADLFQVPVSEVGITGPGP